MSAWQRNHKKRKSAFDAWQARVVEAKNMMMKMRPDQLEKRKLYPHLSDMKLVRRILRDHP